MKREAINLSGEHLSPDSLTLKTELEDQMRKIFGNELSVSWFIPPKDYEVKDSHEIIQVDIEE